MLTESNLYGGRILSDGGSEVFSGEIIIENGTGQWEFPVQKNAEIEEVTVNLKTDQTVLSPSLTVDDVTAWEFPSEYGSLNAQDEFVEGESVKLEVPAEDKNTTHIELPVSTVKTANFNIRREEMETKYNVKVGIEDEIFWVRSDDDSIFGELEDLVSGTDLLTADHIYTGEKNYIATGDLAGRLRIFDDDGFRTEVTPTGERLLRVLFIPCEGDLVRGAFIDWNGEIYNFTFNPLTDELTYDFIIDTHYRNEMFFTHDIIGDGWEDVIAVGEEKILGWFNDGSGELTGFDELYTLPLRPRHVTPAPDGRITTLVYEDTISTMEVLEYDNDTLVPYLNYTFERDIRLFFTVEFTGDGELELLLHNSTGDFEVWKGEDGNMTMLYTLDIDHPINHVMVGDVTGDGKHDFATVAHLSNKVYVYINTGERFSNEYTYSMNGGGYQVNMLDLDDDGDIDVMLVARNRVHALRNRLNWRQEPVGDFTSELKTYIDTATPSYDSWGNPMVTVPITVRSQYAANFTLSDLRVTYDYRPTIDITTPVENYVTNTPANETGWVHVPLTMTADDNCTFDVQVTVRYTERAPILKKPIPDTYAVEWNQTTEAVINLTEYFYDPMGLELIYSVSEQENSDELSASIDGDLVDFRSRIAGTGEYTFKIRANNGLRVQESNEFSVSVVPPSPVMELPGTLKVRENVTTWFEVSPYIDGLEPFGEDWNLTTTSDYITVHKDNLTLELYYTETGLESVTVTLTAGTYTVENTISVEVISYDTPFFKTLPEIFMEKNTVIEEEDGINLRSTDYVDYPGDLDYLTFNITERSDPDIVNLSNDRIVVHPSEGYHGESSITVSVEEPGGLLDTDTITIYVNDTLYPPVYLGGLEDKNVYEDEWWTVNLINYFSHEYPGKLVFESNSDDVKIVNITWALWTPEYGDEDVTDLIFTAYDREYPFLYAESDPIRLNHIMENQPPRYLGGIYPRIVEPGTTWSVHLPDHFDDREDPKNMTYGSSHDEIHIDENWTASWTPDEDSYPLFYVTFTAYDAEDPSLYATSDPINLTIPGMVGPFAVIVSITPETAEEDQIITFVGKAEATIGNVSYQWSSNIDGILSDEREFNTTLTVGTHHITFRVMDERGNWSDPDTATITVEPKEDTPVAVEHESLFQSRPLQLAIVVVIVGLTLNLVGRELNVRNKKKLMDKKT